MPTPAPEHLIVIGASAGGIAALQRLLGALRADLDWPLLVVLHIAESDISGLVALLAAHSALPVVEARHGSTPGPGVHLAPGNYHLLIERDGRLALSIDERVCHARPSIDVLFESAADSIGAGTIGVILSGANDDGARGLARIRTAGGLALIQDPLEAEYPVMPGAALQHAGADAVLPLAALAARLHQEFERCR